MARSLHILLAAASLVAGQSAICPNEVAIYNPQDRTQSFTNNWFLVPIPKEEVKKALQQAFPTLFNLGGLNLLPVPASLNFPAGMHPVVASAGITNDIRKDSFQIATGLMFAGSLIPYVGIGTSQTPLSVPLVNYIAGVDDVTQAYVAGIIPSVVATIAGILFRIGAFIPLSSPFQSYSDGSLGINSKWAQAPNPASGPGIYSEAIDLKFTNEPNQASPRYTLAQWKRILNQPWILANTQSLLNPKCQRSTFYFTNATAVPTFRTGNVTLGPSASVDPLTAVLQKASPDGSGFYKGVYGFTACAQNVGYGAVVPQGEDCEVAAQIVASSPGAL